jgi:DNA-binding response OmpR family regulator
MSPRLTTQVIPLTDLPASVSAKTPDHHLPVVLIVDDERIIADTLALILAKSGFATLTAYDGAAAMELASIVPPQLLISDVVMPGITGVDLAISVVREVPDCKILLLSGQAATADLLGEAYQAGYDFTILTKPLHPAELLRHIARCFQEPKERDWQLPALPYMQLLPALA